MKLNILLYKLILVAGLQCIAFNALAQDSVMGNKTNAQQMQAKDWTTLTCSGFKTWNDCRTQAREICPSGFKTADPLENLLIQRREVSIACKG